MNTRKPVRENPAYVAASSEEKALVDYVHGHITDPQGNHVEGQQAAAAFYEYARMCPVLCALAVASQTRGHQPNAEEDQRIIEKVHGRMTDAVLGYQWLWLHAEAHFPHLPWRDIPLKNRIAISEDTGPLPTLRMIQFAGYGKKAEAANAAAFDEYQQQIRRATSADEQTRINKQFGVPPQAVWRSKSGNEIVVAFRLNTRLSKTRLVNAFREWLELPENAECLVAAKTHANRVVANAADRLKDLAIWKLNERYKGAGDHLLWQRRKRGKNEAKYFEQVRDFLLERRKQDPKGKPLPFLDEKKGRGKGGRPPVEGMANRPQSYFFDAVRRAKECYYESFLFEGRWRQKVEDDAKQQAARDAYLQRFSHLQP